MGGDARDVHAPRANLEEEQDVDRLQEERLDGEEVAGQELLPVPAQAGPPGVAASPALRGGRDVVPLEDVADGRAAEGVAQLAQLAVDPAVAPAPVLGGEPQDQGFQLGGHGWSASRARPRERPFPAHEVAVPAQHGRGLAQHQAAPERAAPGDQAGELGDQDGQGELLPAREPRRTPALPLQDAQLVAEQRDLEVFLVRRSPPARDQIDQERDQVPQDQPGHLPLACRCHIPSTGPHCRRKPRG